MKTSFFNLFAALIFAASLLLSSCSSNNQNQQQAADTTQATNNLMQEAPPYDATKIDATAPVVEITLKARGNTMADMSYSDTLLRVKAGSTVHLSLVNESKDASMSHDFVLIESGNAETVAAEGIKAGPTENFTPKMKQVLVGTKMLAPGEKADITFPAPAKGDYEFICTYPGHWSKMRGKFIVE